MDIHDHGPVERRVESAVLQFIVTEYRDGKPVGESLAKPEKIFRAATPDVWAAIDAALAKVNGA